MLFATFTFHPQNRNRKPPQAGEVFRNVKNQKQMMSVTTKLMNKLVCELDFSTQEINHLLLGLDLSEVSCIVVSVSVFWKRSSPICMWLLMVLIIVERSKRGIFHWWNIKTACYIDITFLVFMKRLDHSKGTARTKPHRDQTLDRILHYFYRYYSEKNPENITVSFTFTFTR